MSFMSTHNKEVFERDDDSQSPQHEGHDANHHLVPSIHRPQTRSDFSLGRRAEPRRSRRLAKLTLINAVKSACGRYRHRRGVCRHGTPGLEERQAR
jgi:hypothetical protein